MKVLNAAGQPVSGVAVSARWSGVTSGTLSRTTNTSGVATFSSAYTRNRGTFTFTVTNTARTGYKYDSALNVETSDSISR